MKNKIITLGPAGTFSNMAASKVAPHSDYIYTKTIPEITNTVEKEENILGVIPIENSISGYVVQTQDSLIQSNVSITGELSIQVRFAILSRVSFEHVKRLYCHPQSFNQIMKFTAKFLPNAEVIFSDSNIHSGELFLNDKIDETAAIVPVPYSEQEKCKPWIKALDIQDYANNTTRFFVIQQKNNVSFDFNKQKTSIYLEFHEDRPSLLFELLREFHVFDINLSSLQSRPSQTEKWCYVFFIDFYNNHRVEKCLESIQNQGIGLKVLGSYNLIS